jgi:hypothetical protein
MGGYVLPLEELERRGYVNYDTGEDPRLTIKRQLAQEDYEKQQKEIERRQWIERNMPRGKQFI